MFDFLSLIKIALLSRALFSIADLSIAEYIETQPLSCYELAVETQTNPEFIERTMRLLMAYDFFTQDEFGKYKHTENSLLLCANHPQTMRPFVLHDDATRWNAIGHLGDALKTGSDSFEMLYNESYFDYIAKHPQLGQRFDEAMNIISESEETIIANTLLFEGSIADIGGGSGRLAQKIVQSNPKVSQAFVLDLCQTIKEGAALCDNVSYILGSFFEPITIKADTFILKRILHDWNDEKAIVILSNIVHAMDASSRLYIIDAVVDQCKDKQMIASIDLLLMTIFGGKERLLKEWEYLCSSVGLRIKTIHNLNGLIHAIECIKA